MFFEYEFCLHGAGPSVCWCREPLPGLGVVLLARHAIDPARSLVIEASAAGRGFAARLGIPMVSADEFFQSSRGEG